MVSVLWNSLAVSFLIPDGPAEKFPVVHVLAGGLVRLARVGGGGGGGARQARTERRGTTEGRQGDHGRHRTDGPANGTEQIVSVRTKTLRRSLAVITVAVDVEETSDDQAK